MLSYAASPATPAQRQAQPSAAPRRAADPAASAAALRAHLHDAPSDVLRDLLGAQLARAVEQRASAAFAVSDAPADGPVIQRWWAGIRQLSGLGILGKPWNWGGNPWDLGGYHKHIFLEDGGDPADVGHMGPDGLGPDSDHSQAEYTRTEEGHDDATMRRAIARHSPAPRYGLTDDNCQRWVNNVLRTYRTLGGKEGRQPDFEMSVF